jgi:integrase
MAKLTAASVARIKPNPRRRLEIPDRLLTGLYFIVQPTGARSWALRYRHDGRTRKLTIGSYPAFELGEAREAARAALQKVQRGIDPAYEHLVARHREHAPDDFGSVVRTYVERRLKPQNRTWRETARLLGLGTDAEDNLLIRKRGLVDRWGARKLGDIRRADIIAALDGLVDDAPIVANRTLAALTSLFNWAASRDLIELNPCTRVERPAPEVHRDRVLADDELRAIWKAAADIGWPSGHIVRLLILTGQRRGEVTGMAWGEVDLEGKLWSLPRERIKNKRSHAVPLSAAAIKIIKAVPPIKSELIFSSNGHGVFNNWHTTKGRLDETSGVQNWHLHDIRRTVASGMAKLGINLPVIEKVLNHASGSFAGIVGVYQHHTFADEKRSALDAWANYVTALVEGRPANVTPLRRAKRSAPGA